MATKETVPVGKTVRQLLMIVVAMFAFGWALVPLYDVICDITGLNGKTAGQYESAETQVVNEDRLVTVQFLASNNASMPWEFRPKVRSMQVHPGKLSSAEFYVKNGTSATMQAQAVPSVTPFRAAKYLHKTECFCFEQQQLAHGEDLDMPLRFIVDSHIPEDVTTITLSYTLYDISEQIDLAAN
ncbi:MAG: cytochrome c oxidase assembly protein subunit 11 [Candidatus Azotimanducaceae bacterium]|jgi:cytochrome c oxidase assembly protein subunit 11